MSVRFEEVNTIQQYKSKHLIQVYASLNFGMKINDGERRIEEKFANHKMKQWGNTINITTIIYINANRQHEL